MHLVTGGGDPEKEAARLGMPVEMILASETYGDVNVYPDNWPVVSLFIDVSTQWRTGPAGAVGLDYTVLPMLFRMREIRSTDRAEMFDGIRIMEAAALAAMRETDE